MTFRCLRQEKYWIIDCFLDAKLQLYAKVQESVCKALVPFHTITSRPVISWGRFPVCGSQVFWMKPEFTSAYWYCSVHHSCTPFCEILRLMTCIASRWNTKTVPATYPLSSLSLFHFFLLPSPSHTLTCEDLCFFTTFHFPFPKWKDLLPQGLWLLITHN